ncbi:MAG TPA: hypothetical protein VF039_06915 [Longimicrobiales bacterium]
MKTIVTVALFALTTVQGPCQDIDDDYPSAGYAVVTGTLPSIDGYAVRSDVHVACGIDEPSDWSTRVDADERGRYRAELEWPFDIGDSELESAGWIGVCRVAAPASAPPYAEASGEVVFAPSRSERVTTTLDLVAVDQGPAR